MTTYTVNQAGQVVPAVPPAPAGAGPGPVVGEVWTLIWPP